MKPRAGFALLAVLWVLTALSATVGLVAGASRTGVRVTLNRLALTRAEWAAQACWAILEARWAAQHLVPADTEDLGRGTRCAWDVSDPTARVDVNRAEPDLLDALLCAHRPGPCAVDSLLRLRAAKALTDLDGVAALPGVDSATLTALTVSGTGAVNVNAAAPSLLLKVPGLTPEALAWLDARRRTGHPVTSVDELAIGLSPVARAALMGHYSDVIHSLAFVPALLLVTARGWVDGAALPPHLAATVEVLVLPLPNRLAVVRQRVW